MKCLVVIPARSGSKRLKNKNKKLFFGRPLIEHTIDFAKKLNFTPYILYQQTIRYLKNCF